MMRRLVLVLALLAVSVVPAFAQDDAQQEGGDFSTLLTALEVADLTVTLAEDGPFTIFAPTDAAFEAALADLGLTAEELLADSQTLIDILLYHVVEGEVPAADVVTLVESAGGTAEITTFGGETITIELVDGLPVINGTATVFLPDVSASNGIIHVIDTVLLPPALAPTDTVMADPATETIVEIAGNTENLTTLVAAVEAAGLVETLSEGGPFTVFAPTNDAFQAALADLGLTAEELLADTDLLTTVLSYHVVDGTLLATDITALVEDPVAGAEIETLGGEPLIITLDETDGTLLLSPLGTTVVTPDVVALNGVVHIIDGVLFPPSLGS